MQPIKKIIAPCDFSGPSKVGLKRAIELAEYFNAELIIVHVISMPHIMPPAGPPTAPGFSTGSLAKELRDAAESKLNEIQKEQLPKGLQSRVILAEGAPADEIARISEEEKADLIIIATHGWTGWRRFIFGSVAEKVIRFAKCEVLTVPEPSQQ